MRVFVAGGTGVLGRRLVPQLGAEAVVMDGLDAASATVLAVEQKATDVYNIVYDDPTPVSE